MSDDSPGRPRRPRRSAASTVLHVSSGAFSDSTGTLMGPFPSPGVMSVRPGQNLFQVERRLGIHPAVGSTFQAWSKPDTGLTPSHRFIVALADGRRVFVKAAASPPTAAWLRNERLALAFSAAEVDTRRGGVDRRWRRCRRSWSPKR